MRRRVFNGTCKQAGFTLVEIVVTIVLVGIVAGIAALIMLQGVRTYSSEQSRSDLHYQARLAMERIAREARQIRSCADISGPANPSGTLSFIDINGAAVTFSVSGNNLLRGADQLAAGITSAQPFRFLGADGITATTACPGIWYIEISLADTQDAETLQMNTRVHPRSF